MNQDNKKAPKFNIIYGMLIFFLVYSIFGSLFGKEEAITTIPEFEDQVRKGIVTQVVINEGSIGSDVSFSFETSDLPDLNDYNQKKAKAKVKVLTVHYPAAFLGQLKKLLDDNNVEYSSKAVTRGFFSFLLSWLPLLLIIGVWLYMSKRSGMMGKGGALSMGKSKAKLLGDNVNTTFEDVAGIDEIKPEVEDIIEFLKDPWNFSKLGARVPKGILLVGAPGTGKTLLAKALAGESGVPFFSMSGSEFVEMFVGVGASRVRDLFAQAKERSPSIIFIDELDAVGRHRGAGLGGGHDEREQTLNQLLVEMDGLEENNYAIIIAATNRPDVLDKALLRPGRFDRQVVVPIPDVKGREAILKVHAKKIPVLAKDVDLVKIAKGTPGFTGADLENLLNEAALHAGRKKSEKVTNADVEYAQEKIMMGVENKSRVISPQEKKIIAYHEAGHTLVAKLTPGADPVHKVSIISRGSALGVTLQLPEQDRLLHTKESLTTLVKILLGGRVAEEIVLKDISTGAQNDLERLTDVVKNMVTKWGMSELGVRTFGKQDDEVFLGRDIGLAQQRDYSDKAAEEIDSQIKIIIKEQYGVVMGLIESNLEILHGISDALMEKETLKEEEINAFFD